MALLKRIVSGMGRLVAWRLGGLLLGLASAPLRAADASAAAPPSSEHQLEAVFLFNFAQFVEWPARTFSQPHAPLVIGVLGDDPFGSYLDDIVRGEKIEGRALTVIRFRRIEEVRDCHILYIGASESERLDTIVAALKGRSVLTVSDAENFARQGGMVRFVKDGSKIRMRINAEAAKSCGVIISSKILRFATIVTAEKG